MLCSFTKRTLRSFIRNVTPVDSIASSSFTYRPQTTNFRNFIIPSIPFLYPSYARAYSSAYSSQCVGNSDEDAPPESREETFTATEGPVNTTQEEIDDMDDLFMEITPESLDALAAETRSELANSKSGESEESEDPMDSIYAREMWKESLVQKEPLDIFSKPTRKPRWDTDVEKTRFRSVKIDNAVSSSPQASTSKPKMVKDDRKPPPREFWMVQNEALKKKFPEGWKPMKKLSPEAQAGIRALHAQYPEEYSTSALANHFRVSAEAIRRILRSKWVPKPEEEEDRAKRWFNRGKSIWNRYAELGVKPPRRWREEGIGRGKPEWKKRAIPVLTTSRPGETPETETETETEPVSLDDELGDRIF